MGSSNFAIYKSRILVFRRLRGTSRNFAEATSGLASFLANGFSLRAIQIDRDV